MSLKLNNMVIESRSSDNFINATQLCKAGGKKFGHWFQLDQTKRLISSLEASFKSSIAIAIPKVVDIQNGGNHSGSWIHPKLAVHLATWLSPEFALQVSDWVLELLSTGTVTIDPSETIKQLEDALAREREAHQKTERKVLRMKDFNETRKHLAKTQVIYLASSKAYQAQNRYKIGGCTTMRTLKSRFSQYNTGRPTDDAFFCTHMWSVHSFTMIEKIAKVVLDEYRDHRTEMYHIHGNALVQVLEFIIQNAGESNEWFNENFKVFDDMTLCDEPIEFPPLTFRSTLSITAGDRSVDVVDITGWDDCKIQQEIDLILETYRNLKNLDKLQENIPIVWGELATIIKQMYKKAKMTDWREAFKVVIPRRSERLQIKGLKCG
jgi:KilA-N domain/T5orf172 domain